MSKKNKIIVNSLIIFIVIAFFVSLIIVDNLNTKQEVLAINSTKVQILYGIGDEFNEESINVYYEDKTGYVKKVEDYVVDSSNFDSSKEGEYEIFVTYKNINTKFNVYVYEKQNLSKVFFDNIKNYTNNVLIEFLSNKAYFNEINSYIEYKNLNDGINKQIFYLNNFYKVYDLLINEYIEDKKIEPAQFFEIITKDKDYDSNLNLSQNIVKRFFDSIFEDVNFEYSFDDGEFYFKNLNSENVMIFDNFGYLELITNSDESFKLYNNVYFEYPSLPADIL